MLGSGSPARPQTLKPISRRRNVKIDHEVRPSTVKTWLTSWQIPSAADRSSAAPSGRQLNKDTVRALNILARTCLSRDPTRPCREMQSDSLPRSRPLRFASARSPPSAREGKNQRSLLTGNSVELVRGGDAMLLTALSTLLAPRAHRQVQPWALDPSSTAPPERINHAVSVSRLLSIKIALVSTMKATKYNSPVRTLKVVVHAVKVESVGSSPEPIRRPSVTVLPMTRNKT